MADDTEGDGAVDTTYTIKVQRATEEFEVDAYGLDDGFKPLIETTSDRELWISKTKDENRTQTLVAVYGQGLWLRAWIEETS
jgi:hypothetical protein